MLYIDNHTVDTIKSVNSDLIILLRVTHGTKLITLEVGKHFIYERG